MVILVWLFETPIILHIHIRNQYHVCSSLLHSMITCLQQQGPETLTWNSHNITTISTSSTSRMIIICPSFITPRQPIQLHDGWNTFKSCGLFQGNWHVNYQTLPHRIEQHVVLLFQLLEMECVEVLECIIVSTPDAPLWANL